MQKKWGKSGLFILWMLVCQILCTTYTGLISSHIVSPSPEHTLSDLTDLDQNNYSIVAEGTSGWIGILNSAPYRLKGKILILQNIYKKYPLRRVTKPEVVLELSGENKVEVMRPWLIALGTANSMNDLIKVQGISNAPKKICHVGEELIPTEEIHFALTPGTLHIEASVES